jgi:hypothetical protein
MASTSQCGPSAKVSSQAAVAVPEKDDDTDTKSRIGDEYILVKKSKSIPIPEKNESKLAIPNLCRSPVMEVGNPRKLNALLRSAMSSFGTSRANGPQIRAILYSKTSVTSGAGAAIAGFFGLTPSASAEFAKYTDLYDEVKVHGVKIHINGVQSAISVNPATAWSVGYDPTYGTVPTSVESVRESSQAIWGIQIQNALLSGLNSVTTVGYSRPRGVEILECKMPTSPVFTDPAVATLNFPGAWTAAADTADTVGYLRYYFTAPGGTNVTVMSLLLEYDCSFRIRT